MSDKSLIDRKAAPPRSKRKKTATFAELVAFVREQEEEAKQKRPSNEEVKKRNELLEDLRRKCNLACGLYEDNDSNKYFASKGIKHEMIL